jgi:anti-anti-sigma factor
MRLTQVSTNEVICLDCEGEISQADFSPGQDPLPERLGPDGFRARVLINLERVEYIDSSGVSWLIVNHKRFREQGGKLVLHSVPPRVDQVFKLLKMHLVLNIQDDAQAARAAALGTAP